MHKRVDFDKLWLIITRWCCVRLYNHAQRRGKRWQEARLKAEHKIEFLRELELRLASIITILGDKL